MSRLENNFNVNLKDHKNKKNTLKIDILNESTLNFTNQVKTRT